MKFTTAALATVALAGTIDPVAGAPDPNLTYIEGITYGGSGCPQDTVSAAFSEDKTTVTLIFDQFIAQTGQGVDIAESRKNCQVNVDLRYPQGWSYSIMSVDYRGFVGIPKGLTAEQKSTYYFSGSRKQASARSSFVGPKYEDYLFTDTIPTSNVVWSACGQVERGNINAQVRLFGNYSLPGMITVDSIDGKVTQLYAFQWKKC
jgi:hypothetical protein